MCVRILICKRNAEDLESFHTNACVCASDSVSTALKTQNYEMLGCMCVRASECACVVGRVCNLKIRFRISRPLPGLNVSKVRLVF